MDAGPRIVWLVALVLLPAACQVPADAGSPEGSARVRCPELHWTAFPSESDLARDLQGRLREAQRIGYQLRVFDRTCGDLVFERRGLNETRHRPELWLDTSRRYVWTVRPEFWIGRERRVGDWLGRRPATSGPSETARSPVVPLPFDLLPVVVLPVSGEDSTE